MIKSVLRLAVVLVIGILVYNYFLGTPEEKASAKNIGNKVLDIGKAGVGLLKDEYKKFRDGKYDKALDKVGNLLDKAKQKGGEYVNDIKDWEERKAAWDQKKDELEKMMEGDEDKISEEDMKKAIEDLKQEGKQLEKEGKALQEKVDK